MQTAFFFAFLSFLAYAGQFGILLFLHSAQSGYSPVRHAVSDYGVGRTKYLFRVRAWMDSFGAVALAISFLLGLGPSPVLHAVVILLFLLAAARVGAGAFPTDLEGQKLTRTGLLHYIFAILSFGFAYTVISKMTAFFSAQPGWHPMQSPLSILAAIAAPALAAVVVTMWKPLRNIFGLCERVFIVTVGLWFLAVSGFFAFLLR